MALMTRKHVYLAWGLFDAFFICWYMIWSLIKGRIPFFTDLMNSLAVYRDWSGGTSWSILAVLSSVLCVSIIFSAILFLRGSRFACYLGWAQIPFRILFYVPSVSLLVVLGFVLPDSIKLNLMPFLWLSEIIKAWSLWKYR